VSSESENCVVRVERRVGRPWLDYPLNLSWKCLTCCWPNKLGGEVEGVLLVWRNGAQLVEGADILPETDQLGRVTEPVVSRRTAYMDAILLGNLLIKKSEPV